MLLLEADFVATLRGAVRQQRAAAYAALLPSLVNAAAQDSRVPKLEKTTVTIGVRIEDWNIFTHRWRVFKDGCGIAETSAFSQLFRCASCKLDASLLKSDANIVTLLSADLLTAMQRLAVILIATGVCKSELMQMPQMRYGTSRFFAARIRRKADTCAFSANCSCGLEVNYIDQAICNTLLNGIADSEILREILGTADILTSAINDAIALAENKEMTLNAIPSADVSAMSEFKRVKNSAQEKDHQISARKQFTSTPSDHSTRLPCPGCNRLFSLYREGQRDWNTRPYTLCLDCFRKIRRNQLAATSPQPQFTLLTSRTRVLRS